MKMMIKSELVPVESIGEIAPTVVAQNPDLQGPDGLLVAGVYLHPQHPDNPEPGTHRVELNAQATEPPVLISMCQSLQDRVAGYDLPADYSDLATAYRALVGQIEARMDVDRATAMQQRTKRHELTHKDQQVRMEQSTITVGALTLPGHWYEDAPYPQTREIKGQARVVGALAEAQALIEGNRAVGIDPAITTDLTVLSMHWVLEMLQEVPDGGCLVLDQVHQAVRTGDYSDLELPDVERSLAYLILLTGNARLLTQIHEDEVSAQDLRMAIVDRARQILSEPEVMVEVMADESLMMDVDMELMTNVADMRSKIAALKASE